MGSSSGNFVAQIYLGYVIFCFKVKSIFFSKTRCVTSFLKFCNNNLTKKFPLEKCSQIYCSSSFLDALNSVMLFWLDVQKPKSFSEN